MESKRIHVIAMGGAAMHTLAIALKDQGHQVTGSDDEFYNPSKDRLKANGLLPDSNGWEASRITPDIDFIIIGMHARPNNPELLQAQELDLTIYSYPEYIAEYAKDKKRIVVAGSHGKTTTTSMIMHLLTAQNADFDYLVGAAPANYAHNVKLSDAPVMVIEGDEYLASPIDRRAKMLLYRPHLAIITGIAWDHMNVFPKYEDYVGAFQDFVETIVPGGTVFYASEDDALRQMIQSSTRTDITFVPYSALDYKITDEEVYVTDAAIPGERLQMSIFGKHNLTNFQAAISLTEKLDYDRSVLLRAAQSCEGAQKRLQGLANSGSNRVYLDFAHAPSKVKATIDAVVSQYPDKNWVVALELHSYSSLNKDFLPQYQHALDLADKALVYYNPHTLEMKQMPTLEESYLQDSFGRKDLLISNDGPEVIEWTLDQAAPNTGLLLMSSGNFNGANFKDWADLWMELAK